MQVERSAGDGSTPIDVGQTTRVCTSRIQAIVFSQPNAGRFAVAHADSSMPTCRPWCGRRSRCRPPRASMYASRAGWSPVRADGLDDDLAHVITRLSAPTVRCRARGPGAVRRVQHQQARLALRGAVGGRRHRVGNQAVASVNRWPRYASRGSAPFDLRVQPRIGRSVFEPCASGVHLLLGPRAVASVPVGAAVLPLNNSSGSPRLDRVPSTVKCSSDIRPAARSTTRRTKLRAISWFSSRSTILGEHRRRPDRLVHVPCRRSSETAVGQLFHQQALAANRIRRSASAAPAGRSARRAASDAGVQSIELRDMSRSASSTNAPNRPESDAPSARRCSRGHITEHRIGECGRLLACPTWYAPRTTASTA